MTSCMPGRLTKGLFPENQEGRPETSLHGVVRRLSPDIAILYYWGLRYRQST